MLLQLNHACNAANSGTTNRQHTHAWYNSGTTVSSGTTPAIQRYNSCTSNYQLLHTWYAHDAQRHLCLPCMMCHFLNPKP
mmetsp:Transcript_16976/g.36714  ORF Transcript_16976/g.36714 Transcript_16976/m.36714 type:complete len:80 (-) Transcript_16976:286-525(-)